MTAKTTNDTFSNEIPNGRHIQNEWNAFICVEVVSTLRLSHLNCVAYTYSGTKFGIDWADLAFKCSSKKRSN